MENERMRSAMSCRAWIDRHPDLTTLPWYFVY